MPRKKAEPPANHVSLHIGSAFSAAWQEVVLPWFKRVSLASITSDSPIAVVTPCPSCAAFLRARLLESEIPLLGIKFLTPPQLRELLLADSADTLPLREHLRLLLASAAESATENSGDVDLAAVAKSIARAPDNLLRAFDRVSAAGWDFGRTGPPTARHIVKRFRDLVRNSGFQMVHEADRRVVDSAKAAMPRLNEILLIGFTAAHWPLFPLLQAATLSAKRATVVLENPREQTTLADQCWIGTWEQAFRPSEQVTEENARQRPFADLIRPETTARLDRKQPCFLVGLNATEQAQAISTTVCKFLVEKSCTRIGILFPRAGALPRLVSDLLTRAGILHYDGIGHLAPGDFEQPDWQAWLRMQENPQLESVLRFLEASSELQAGLPIEELRRLLRRAYRNVLIDDINVLSAYCRRQPENEALFKVGTLLRDLQFLPTRSTLKTFLSETAKIFSNLKWKNRWTEISQFAGKRSEKAPGEFSRSIYLRWLDEISNSLSFARPPSGNHPYSRVHLLSYTDAETHEWSHLILAGLNQGEWPPVQQDSAFLPDEKIAELNKQAIKTGQQGEGHLIIEEGKTFLLGAQEERRIALRQFGAALESAEHGIAITASLHQESAPERSWNPSELFSQIYFATTGTPLSQQTMSTMRDQTNEWLLECHLAQSPHSNGSAIQQTRTAYSARRTPEIAFGEYEFALRQPIDRDITLSTTEWTKVLKTPALVWLDKYLGVENEEPDLNQWNVATGTWVHDWLAFIGGQLENSFVDFPTSDQIRERISQAATEYRTMIADLCATAGRLVPDWWMSGWSNALALARFFANKLAEVQGWSQMTTEWKLESPQLVSIDDQRKLRLRGRIDLILAQKPPKGGQLTGADLWIVDYKTGNVKALTPAGKTEEFRAANLRKKLVRGDAIQLGLYGLAARELGARELDLSIVSLRTDLDRPQLTLDALTAPAFADFWRELYQMQENGVFGLRGAIRNEFGFTPDYPLATLPIDKEFLDEKWVATHSAFADDEESW